MPPPRLRSLKLYGLLKTTTTPPRPSLPLNAPLRLPLFSPQQQPAHPQQHDARPFHTPPTLHSGHNRWSKIKHDKARVDATRSKARSQLTRDLAQASKTGGPDPSLNPKLASLIASAKKLGFTKTSTSAAIERGQGRSSSGRALEPFLVELLHAPTGVALLVECMTDNKARALQEVREAMKGSGASEGSVEWMFERRGKVSFVHAQSGKKRDKEEEQIMDVAGQADVVDLDFGEGGTVELVTKAEKLKAVAERLGKAMRKRPERMEMVRVPRFHTLVEVVEESDEALSLQRLVDKVEDLDSVAAVWVNSKKAPDWMDMITEENSRSEI